MKSNCIIRKTTKINDSLMEQCNALYQICCDYDALKHPCCFEDEFDVFTDYPRLYYATFKGDLSGFLSTYIIDQNSVEFCIFVHPKFRNKKIATTLFKQFANDYDMENIEASVSPDNQAGICFLKKNYFHSFSTELLMSAQLKNFIPKEYTKLNTIKTSLFNSFKYIIDNECVGLCNISFLSDTHICISDMEIFEKYQNHGLGFQFLHKILQEMSRHFDNVILHVTKENLPAYKLYKKLGFEETDSTLTYILQKNRL